MDWLSVAVGLGTCFGSVIAGWAFVEAKADDAKAKRLAKNDEARAQTEGQGGLSESKSPACLPHTAKSSTTLTLARKLPWRIEMAQDRLRWELESKHDRLRWGIESKHDRLRWDIKSKHDQLRWDIKSKHDQLRWELDRLRADRDQLRRAQEQLRKDQMELDARVARIRGEMTGYDFRLDGLRGDLRALILARTRHKRARRN